MESAQGEQVELQLILLEQIHHLAAAVVLDKGVPLRMGQNDLIAGKRRLEKNIERMDAVTADRELGQHMPPRHGQRLARHALGKLVVNEILGCQPHVQPRFGTEGGKLAPQIRLGAAVIGTVDQMRRQIHAPHPHALHPELQVAALFGRGDTVVHPRQEVAVDVVVAVEQVGEVIMLAAKTEHIAKNRVCYTMVRK